MTGDLAARQRRARARYEFARGLALAALVAAVLVALVLLLLQGRDINRQGVAQVQTQKDQKLLSEQLVRQGEQIQEVLDQQSADVAERAARLRAAAVELTKVQQAQLDAHDDDVTRRLQAILTEIGRLQIPPRRIVLPARTAPRTTAPAPTRMIGPPTQPAPAPAPSPCTTSGKSSRCKR